jgi:hypothetical protein
MVTGIDNEHDRIPLQFKLERNYPNPFNPSTTISFSLPTSGFVNLKIYDLSGREAATLVSGPMPAGKHSILWNATGMPSGVYCCRLQAGSLNETMKMILIK